MKISKQKVAEFQPITITLENQEEVDQMFALANYNVFRNRDLSQSLMGLEDFILKYYMPVERDDSLVVTFQ